MIKLVNTVGKEWDFAQTQRIEFLAKNEFVFNQVLDMGEVIEVTGLLLKHGEIGSLMYDLLLEMLEEKKNLKRIRECMKKITLGINIYDFVLTMRNIITGEDSLGSNILSALLKTICLTLHGYGLGRIEGVVSDKKKVVVSESIDAYDMILMMWLEINSRPTLVKKLRGFDTIYGSDVKRYMKYLRTRDTSNLMGQLKTFGEKELVDFVNNAVSSVCFTYVNNMFNEVDKHFYPEYDFLETVGWGREDTVESNDSALISYFQFLVIELLEPSFLKSRKFYVRDKGVRIVFKEPVGGIRFIELREVHLDNRYDEHYLNFFYTTEEGYTRMFYLSMKNIANATVPLLYEKDVDVCMMVFTWLGLLDTYFVTAEKLYCIGKVEYKGTWEIKDYEEPAAELNKFIEHYKSAMDEENYYYESPSHWNYDTCKADKTRASRSGHIEKLTKVGRYTRRLPAGQKASPSAVALANKYYIELREGYTLVDEFTKVTKVKV